MTIRKVSAHPAGSNFIYLPKKWYELQKTTGWNGKEVSITPTSKLCIEPYPTQYHPFIMSKTPLRLPLGGGGSDLPEYYTTHNGGTWLSATINSYIYILIKHRFETQSKFVYSETQYVDAPSQFHNPILRAVLTKYNLVQHLELISLADLPAHLGLGSSGAFTVGLLKAVHAYLNLNRTISEVAEEAFEIERCTNGCKIGKQDQYATAHGGFNIFESNTEGRITSIPLHIPDLQKWLLLFYVNKRSIPADQALSTMTDTDREKIAYIGKQSIQVLLNNDFLAYGNLLDQHWEIKKQTQPQQFHELIELAKIHGAIGGKLCGAGMGGCIMLLVPPSKQINVIEAMTSANIIQLQFSFTSFGSEVYN